MGPGDNDIALLVERENCIVKITRNGTGGWYARTIGSRRIRGEAVRRSLSEISPVLTVRDLGAYLRVHPSTIYRLLKTGQLPAFKVGSDWRFNVEEIDRWRVEREKNPGM
jgi:excisionase family DNA binding protein